MVKRLLTKLREEETRVPDGEQTASDSERRHEAAPERAEPPSADGSTGADTPAEEMTIGLDQIFGLLRNRRRRDVLWYLLGTDEQVSLSDLAETIAARECDKPVSQITSQERKRVYIGLYQGHLPKMDDCNAIEYDQQRGTIERGSNFDVFVDYLPDEEEVLGTTDEERRLLQTLVSLIT